MVAEGLTARFMPGGIDPWKKAGLPFLEVIPG
jgi:hypothetical protein